MRPVPSTARAIRSGVLVGALALALAGCGSDPEEQPAATTPSASVASGDATACGRAALGEWRATLRQALDADPADRAALRGAVRAAREQSGWFAEQAQSPGLVRAYREAAATLTAYAAALAPPPPAAELARLREQAGSVQGAVLVACAEALGG
ncbi:hypothetical protein SAMN04488570_2548 [Nocardioides scoriae]|uniref:Lipoprotein n=1 Tax=Nocardioides scoriae TaxID=642780 RepID=A0A1H1UKH8_9ACTN|nr:hypothetical protein [Nocardioides scoriae]SDS72810.1 hypothetical protein SAMN04488570_2548 [Nocardioides scoriae]